MKIIKSRGSSQRRLKKLVRKLGIPRLLGMLAALILVFQFWLLPALTQQPVVITMLMQGQDLSNWRPFLDEFQQQNRDIRLNLIEGPFDSNLQENLLTSAFLLGDSPYDILNLDIAWVPKFAAAGWLSPLGDRVPPEELAELVENNIEGGRYNGELYRMPTTSDAGVLYYRTDLLQQGGYDPPETFREMVEIIQDLQKPGDTDAGETDWGYLWQGRQYEGLSAMFVEVIEGFGGFWVNPDTLEVGLDQPQGIEAVEFLRSTITRGISPPGVTTYGEEETRLLFQSGESVFLRNWPYVWRLANAEGSEVRGKVGIRPMVSSVGNNGGSCLGGWGLGISLTAPHPDEAWRVIEYMTSKETMRRFVLETGLLPSHKDLFTDPAIVAKYPYFPPLLEALQQSVLRPPIAQYAQASDILQRYLSAAFTGSMTPERAMQAAAAETRNLLGRLAPAQASQNPVEAQKLAIRS
jgi:multiple sugar transport system substrate-binding protein